MQRGPFLSQELELSDEELSARQYEQALGILKNEESEARAKSLEFHLENQESRRTIKQ